MAPAILRDCRMAAGPRPVVVLASLIDGGTGIDLQVPGCRDPRLGAGSRHDPAGCAEHASLSETIVAAAAAGPGELPPAKGVEGTTRGGASPTEKWIMVGASTGGVEAIETLLGGFPADCPPTLITQHMPPQFLKSFATRLNGLVRPQVAIARDGITPKRGEVFIAPGGETHLVLDPALRVLRLWPGPKVSGYRPSVDAMFASAVPYASRTIAVILTGMGGDGARSMKALRDGGALCIGQDRESSVIYGMPRMAHELGATEIELPLGQIAPHALAAAQAPRVA
jgi:two-component system, chemotaxis family, protein-glutamate methylesterase/glutaminase